MSFMKPYIYGPQFGWRVETDNGTEYLPDDVYGIPQGWHSTVGQVWTDEQAEFETVADHMQEFCEGTIQTIEVIYGYFGRYSADGYMDCTPWHFDTDEQSLRAELDEHYGDDETEECDE